MHFLRHRDAHQRQKGRCDVRELSRIPDERTRFPADVAQRNLRKGVLRNDIVVLIEHVVRISVIRGQENLTSGKNIQNHAKLGRMKELREKQECYQD